MGVIPIVAEALDITPKWLKTILFLSILVGVTVTITWVSVIRDTLDGMTALIGQAMGISGFTLSALILISFLSIPTFYALKVRA